MWLVCDFELSKIPPPHHCCWDIEGHTDTDDGNQNSNANNLASCREYVPL